MSSAHDGDDELTGTAMQHFRNSIIAGFAVLALISGCASTAHRPIHASAAAGTDTPTTQESPEARVTCTCGTWAGARGAPTQCRKLTLERAHQKELAKQQTTSPAS